MSEWSGKISKLTRIVVVDQDGAHEFWGDRWDFAIQDGGKTWKLFQKDGYGAAAKAIRDTTLVRQACKDLSQWGKENQPDD